MGIHETSLWYQKLGVRPIINARGHQTIMGGSLMAPEVAAAMADAARQFAPIPELLTAAGKRIAEQIGVPGAFLSNGAAACLAVAAAAAVAGDDPKRARQLPHIDWGRDQFIIPHSQRFGYDQAYELCGARFVEVGDDGGATLAEIESAITDRTAAIMLLGNPARAARCTVAEIVAVARPRGVAVIVDSASELPPHTNLRRWIDEGADMVIFSGGKGLHGPQQSGLILCRTEEWVRACAVNGAPNSAVGRPMKVGKEEIVGLVAAVERYVNLDHAAEDRRMRAVAEQIVAGVAGQSGIAAEVGAGLAGVPAGRAMSGGHRVPVAILTVDPAAAGIDTAEIDRWLREGEPRIFLTVSGDELWLNPQTIYGDEGGIIVDRLLAVLAEARVAQPVATT
jgi:L-seryl-tRNA(Ser) seleniumtransferase